MTHGDLVNACLLTLSQRGALVWANATGAALTPTRLIRYGFKGSHDILGVLPGGRALGVEVKVGRDTVKPHQARFHEAFTKRGGLSLVVRSLADLEAGLPC